MTSPLARLSRAVSRASLLAAMAGLVGMTAIIAAQVFHRYVLGDSLAWAEQTALLLMSYAILLATAAGVREGFHIRLGLLADAAPPRVAAIMSVAAHTVVLLFGAAMAVWGGELVVRTWVHTLPVLGLPRGVAYLALPISGGLICLFSLEHIVARLRGRTVDPPWN